MGGRYRLFTGRNGARLLPVKPFSVLVESAPEKPLAAVKYELRTRTDSLPATCPEERLVILASCQLFTTYLKKAPCRRVMTGAQMKEITARWRWSSAPDPRSRRKLP